MACGTCYIILWYIMKLNNEWPPWEHVQMRAPPRAQPLDPTPRFLCLSPLTATVLRWCCPGMHSPALGDGHSLCHAVSISQHIRCSFSQLNSNNLSHVYFCAIYMKSLHNGGTNYLVKSDDYPQIPCYTAYRTSISYLYKYTTPVQ